MDIFARFVQADAMLTRTYAGTGLGVAIARTLATAMSGKLAVERATGRKITFTLPLPLHGGQA